MWLLYVSHARFVAPGQEAASSREPANPGRVWEDARVRTHVALLRGINVGGNNKVPMADLRELMTSLGYTDVATYIQSGNVVFTSQDTDSGKLADVLDEKIAERFGVPGHVVVVSRDELARVIADNPYPDEFNPKALHAVFRKSDLTADDLDRVEKARQRASDKGCHDEVTVAARTLFLHAPDGIGRSELAIQLSRTSSMKAGTARNWATVTKLMAMLDE